MSERREYHESALVVNSGPFSGQLIKAEGALCPDGIRRTARPSYDGVADTFFSIPARVHAKGTTVAGYVTIETVEGYTTPSGDDPLTVKFRPYRYRKNYGLIEVGPDDPCPKCGSGHHLGNDHPSAPREQACGDCGHRWERVDG